MPLSLLLSLGLLCLWLRVVRATETGHASSVRGGDREHDRELLLPGLSAPLASVPSFHTSGEAAPRCLGALAVVQRGTDCSSYTGLFSSGRSQMQRTQNRNCRKAWLAGGEGDQERGNQDSEPRPPCAPLCGSSSDPPRRPAWEPGCSRSVWLQPLQHLLAMNKDGVAEAGLGVGAGGRSI